MKYKYELYETDFGSTSGKYGQWLGQDLFTEGNTLDELLDNATYSLVDQDGGEAGQTPADDKHAMTFITEWYKQQINNEADEFLAFLKEGVK